MFPLPSFPTLVAIWLVNTLDSGVSSKPQPTGFTVIRAFNAFQLVTLFTAMPYLIGWLWTGPFPFSLAAFWTALCAYIALFILGVVSTTHFLYSYDK